MRKKVLILFGGNSDEHYISCLSCKSIMENIDKNLFEVDCVGISKEGKWYYFNDDLAFLEVGNWLTKCKQSINNIVDMLNKYDVVFPIMHGKVGEDGRIQGFLDVLGIKYVGCDIGSSVLGINKELSKILFNDIAIPQVPYITIKRGKHNYDDIIKKLGKELIIKPCSCGSSIGVNKVENRRQFKKALETAFKYGDTVMVEKFIHGKELECGILEDKKIIVSKVGEILTTNSFYDYEAKYECDSKTIVPAHLKDEIEKKIQEYAVLAFNKLGCKGLSRIDFFYDESNDEIYLNEINTMPGFTTISMYPKLFMNMGYTYKELITVLINEAIN